MQLVFWYNGTVRLVAIGPQTLVGSKMLTEGAGGVTIGDETGPRPDLYPGWTPVVPGQIQHANSAYGITRESFEGDTAYFKTDRPVPPEAIRQVPPTVPPVVPPAVPPDSIRRQIELQILEARRLLQFNVPASDARTQALARLTEALAHLAAIQ